jgi:hypothetical protein
LFSSGLRGQVTRPKIVSPITPAADIFSKDRMKGGKFVPTEIEKSRKQNSPGRVAAGALRQVTSLRAISSSG